MANFELKGAAARNWIADELIKSQGAEKALENTCGAMHEAVKAAIATNSIAAILAAKEVP